MAGIKTLGSNSKIRYLTKSLVRTALTCPRKLVYATNSAYPRNNDKEDDPFIRHLSEEGQRFGDYCKGLFPHGVEITPNISRSLEVDGKTSHDDVSKSLDVDGLIASTRRLLLNSQQRVTLFEGAISHDSYFVRPDILDRSTSISSNGTELRVIEVKSKSWDSRYSIESKMWNANRTSIKATYLPYIQDIAFQTFVVRLAYPEVEHVSSWLMMPDRAKKMNRKLMLDSVKESAIKTSIPTLEETQQTIDDSVATLLNVDELVDSALTSSVSYPGNRMGETFQDVIQSWVELLNGQDFGLTSISPPHVGSQCASCEYRIKSIPSKNTFSGFDTCWEEASGLTKDEIQKEPLVVDLYGYTKSVIKKFLNEDRYFLRDLSVGEFKDKKKNESTKSISSMQRQWYQVETTQRKANDSVRTPQYVIRSESLRHEMQRWKYPLHFIDFETASPVLPYHEGMSPYDMFAFQFSHHTMTDSLEVYHASEFLHAERGACPNEPFLHALYDAIGAFGGGTVFQWSAHENNVLSSMLKSTVYTSSLSSREIESLSVLLSKGSHPMVDLCKLAKDYYYVDGSGGSSSIKRLLLPTLNASKRLQHIYGSSTYTGKNFDNFQWYQLDECDNAIDPYELLARIKYNQHDDEATISERSSVAHGGAAAAAYHELQSYDMSESERKALESSLLRYCELDTLSMAMIVQAWHGFLEDEQ
jgi:hypothetical protein